MPSTITVHRIVSRTLRAKGEKIESVDKARMERRLREVQQSEDPNAKLLSIPRTR